MKALGQDPLVEAVDRVAAARSARDQRMIERFLDEAAEAVLEIVAARREATATGAG